MDIKPIETLYLGNRFRSRLEARWAVAMNDVGMKYEYEKEGFRLICGPYLPDFWLPYHSDMNDTIHKNAGHWLEVKGKEPSQHELTALLHLSLETNHSGILVWGPPWDFKKYFTHRSGNHGWIQEIEDDVIPPFWLLAQRFARCSFQDADQAIAKAKAARFEHGETPPQPTTPPIGEGR